MNILFINNTSSEYHIGCYGVSSSIINSIYEKYNHNCYIHSVYTEEIKSKKHEKLKALIDFKEWDEVIVNGEGSLHLSNIEGKKIFQLIDYLIDRVGHKKIAIINASIYELNDDWLKTLGRVERIEVRDKFSQNFLKSKGICSEFKLDRLFEFLERNYSDKFALNSKPNCNIIFDAVNKSHKDILDSIGYELEVCEYGTVDLSPIYTFKSGIYSIRDCKDINRIFKFYLRLIYRSCKYKFLPGRKYICNIERDLIDNISGFHNIITARYHIVVLCLFLGVSFSYLPSNTKKIQHVIDLFKDEFPGKIIESFLDNGLISVSLQYSKNERLDLMKKMDYKL